MRDDFAVFIMVYGRPQEMWTYDSLRRGGYTGKIYLVADNTDEAVDGYRERYGDDLLVFDKHEAYKKMDSGDNSGDLRSTLYSANTIFDLARERGIKYFMIMCDDYLNFNYTHDIDFNYKKRPIKSLDKIINIMIEFYKNTPTMTLAMAQGGDFIGGKQSKNTDVQLMRKAMNTFLCDVDRPFQFMGRLNEDVTTYVNLGSKGKLFFTTTNLNINQQVSQSREGGLTDVYLDYGTYVKSFFSVMYNPSSVVVSIMHAKNERIHHAVRWGNAVPKIISEDYKI